MGILPECLSVPTQARRDHQRPLELQCQMVSDHVGPLEEQRGEFTAKLPLQFPTIYFIINLFIEL